MSQPVELLRKLEPVVHHQCDCCNRWVKWLSSRSWCAACERECRAVHACMIARGLIAGPVSNTPTNLQEFQT